MIFFHEISNEKYYVLVLSAEVCLARSSKTCISMWYFLRFRLICTQNQLLDFFHHRLVGQFYLFIRLPDDLTLPECVCCLHSYFHGLKVAKVLLVVAFFIVNLIFSESTCRIFIVNILQDSFEFLKDDSEKNLGLCTLLRSPDKSIIPRIAEISGWIDFCGKPLKTRFKTPFLFFLQKFIKNFVWAKNMLEPTGRLVEDSVVTWP